MIREQGEIRELRGDSVRVALRAHGGCGSCSSSSGKGGSCHGGDNRLLELPNRLGARLGNQIELEVPAGERGGKQLVGALFVVVPAVAAGAVAERLWWLLRSGGEVPALLLLAAVIVGGGLGLGLLGRWRRRQRPRMVRIV